MGAFHKSYLTTPEAAKFLNCSESFLEKARTIGKPKIKFRKLGRKVLYCRRDLESYLDGQVRTSTKDKERSQDG